MKFASEIILRLRDTSPLQSIKSPIKLAINTSPITSRRIVREKVHPEEIEAIVSRQVIESEREEEKSSRLIFKSTFCLGVSFCIGRGSVFKHRESRSTQDAESEFRSKPLKCPK